MEPAPPTRHLLRRMDVIISLALCAVFLPLGLAIAGWRGVVPRSVALAGCALVGCLQLAIAWFA